jgi:PAS domain S-box-containing protein
MSAKDVFRDQPAGSTAALLMASNGNSKIPPDDLKVHILLVDDRADKLLALEAVLADLDVNLVRARSGKEALRRLLERDFAVLLLDVSMPGMDGFETASLIRQRPRTEHTPIIFITSIGTTENHIARGYSLGAVDYLLTPIIPEVLRSKVSTFVELHRQTELGKKHAELVRHLEEKKFRDELAAVSDRLESETKRNLFFTLALDMLGIADFQGRLLQVNPAWNRVLGYAEDELQHLSGLDLVHPEDRPSMEGQMAELKTGVSIAHFDGRYRHKNGSYRWLQWSATPFLEEKLIYIFARDITVRKSAEAEVRELNSQLQMRVAALTEANRELEAFNYSIAHDLRTPLRSMSGFAKALAEDESAGLTPTGLDYARRIVHSAKFMDALLLDMLTYSQLSRAEMVPTPVQLEGPVNEILEVMSKEIADARAQIEVMSPLGTVNIHVPTFKQILANLIGNGLKFTASDRPPRLRILSTCEPSFVRLWIEDNGIGIAPEHHEKIFGMFQRLHDPKTYPGTGIGLALVRRGAERMGGRAGVESQASQGSRFWVDLPAAGAKLNGN